MYVLFILEKTEQKGSIDLFGSSRVNGRQNARRMQELKKELKNLINIASVKTFLQFTAN